MSRLPQKNFVTKSLNFFFRRHFWGKCMKKQKQLSSSLPFIFTSQFHSPRLLEVASWCVWVFVCLCVLDPSCQLCMCFAYVFFFCVFSPSSSDLNDAADTNGQPERPMSPSEKRAQDAEERAAKREARLVATKKYTKKKQRGNEEDRGTKSKQKELRRRREKERNKKRKRTN